MENKETIKLSANKEELQYQSQIRKLLKGRQ